VTNPYVYKSVSCFSMSHITRYLSFILCDFKIINLLSDKISLFFLSSNAEKSCTNLHRNLYESCHHYTDKESLLHAYDEHALGTSPTNNQIAALLEGG
jgi:hypothetical protein